MPGSFAVQCTNCGGVTTFQESDEIQQGMACKYCGAPLAIPDAVLAARRPKVSAPPIIQPPVQDLPIQGQAIQISIGGVSTTTSRASKGIGWCSCLFTLIIVAVSFGVPLVLAGSQFTDMFDSVRNQINNTFNTKDIEINRTLKGFDIRASYLTYSPDGRLIAGAASDGIIIWDAVNGTRMSNIEQTFGATRLVFTRDGERLLTNNGSNLVFYSTGDGRIVQSFDCRCNTFDLSPDNETVVWINYDDQVLLVSSANGSTIRQLGTVEDYFGQIEFSPDGRFVVAAGTSGRLIAWDVVNGQNLFDGSSNLSSSDQFAFHPTENTLAIGQNDELEFYAISEQGLRFVRSNKLGESFFSIQGITYSPDGKDIAMGNFFDGVWIWNVEDKRVTTKLKSEEGIDTVAYSPDGSTVIGAGWLGDVFEWQIRKPSQSALPPTQAPAVEAFPTFTLAPTSAFPALMRTSTPAPQVEKPALNCTVQPGAQAARIRSGPGTDFAVMGNLSAAASANGQNTGSDGFTWWRLADGRGWVREDVVEESGNCDQLPPAS